MASDSFTVAAYYFPNYHPDPRNAQVHGPGWSEWELVKQARPRFAGHRQPRVPLWGYEDESDPAVMARKIDAAASHGIGAFLFDWYHYEDGPFLERALDEGFLGAPNHDRLKFALMWANHDWLNLHPAGLYETREGLQRLLYPGAVSPAAFERITDRVIERYFSHPSYWLIDGAPYFSIYDLPALVKGLGGVKPAAVSLARFRQKTRAAGFRDLHLNQVLWNSGVLPGERAVRQPGEMLTALGFDSFTSYVWIHHAPLAQFPETGYGWMFEQYLRYWREQAAGVGLPYYPNATVGWDPSPRTVQSDSFVNAGYTFTPTLGGATPAAFQAALEAIRAEMDLTHSPRIVTVNAWNEWTEGSYLEPDTHHGMGYLEAIRAVFGGGG
jgi:hypothetical protein